MKGIVFCEFISMVEESFSPEIADRIISESSLETGGAYTSVGTYKHSEIVELVGRLSTATGIAVPDLLRAFGSHLLKRFAALYPGYFAAQDSAFSFLSILDNKIHVEVRKLYPDAELPRFEHSFPDPDRMVLVYRSKRPFGDLAEGLILGCIEFYGGGVKLARENVPCDDGSHIRFTLTR